MSSNIRSYLRKKYISDACYKPPTSFITKLTSEEGWLASLAERVHAAAKPDMTLADLLREYKRHTSPSSTSKQYQNIEDQLKFIYTFITTNNLTNITGIALKLTEQVTACSDGFAIRVNEAVTGLVEPQNIEEELYRVRFSLVEDVARGYINEITVGDGYQIHAFNWVFIEANRLGLQVTPPNGTDPYYTGNVFTITRKLNQKFDDEFIPSLLPSRIADDIRSFLTENRGYHGAVKSEYKLDEYEKWTPYLLKLFPGLSVDDLYCTKDENEFGTGLVIDINWVTVRNGVLKNLIAGNYIQLKNEEKAALDWLLAPSPWNASSIQPPVNLGCLFAGNGYIANADELLQLLDCILTNEPQKKSLLIGQYIQGTDSKLAALIRSLDKAENKALKEELYPLILDSMLTNQYPLEKVGSFILSYLAFKPGAEASIQEKLTRYFQANHLTPFEKIKAWKRFDDQIRGEIEQVKCRRIIKNAWNDAGVAIPSVLPDNPGIFNSIINALSGQRAVLQRFLREINETPIYESLYQSIMKAETPFGAAMENKSLIDDLFDYFSPNQQGALFNLQDEDGSNFLLKQHSPRYLQALQHFPVSLQETLITSVNNDGLTALMKAVLEMPDLVEPILDLLCSTTVSTEKKCAVLAADYNSESENLGNPLLVSLQSQPTVSQAILNTMLTLPETSQAEIFGQNQVRYFMRAPYALFGSLSQLIKTLPHERKLQILFERNTTFAELQEILVNTDNTMLRVDWLKAYFHTKDEDILIRSMDALLSRSPPIQGLESALINWIKDDETAQKKIEMVLKRDFFKTSRITSDNIEKHKKALRWIALLPQSLRFDYIVNTLVEDNLLSHYLSTNLRLNFVDPYLSLLFSIEPEQRLRLFLMPVNDQGENIFQLFIRKNDNKRITSLVSDGLSDLSPQQIASLLILPETKKIRGTFLERSVLVEIVNNQTPQNLLLLLNELAITPRDILLSALNNASYAEKLKDYIPTLCQEQDVDETFIKNHQDLLKVTSLLPPKMVLNYFELTLKPQGLFKSCLNNPLCKELIMDYFKAFNRLPVTERQRLCQMVVDEDGNNLLMLIDKKYTSVLGPEVHSIIEDLLRVNPGAGRQSNEYGESYAGLRVRQQLKKFDGTSLIKEIGKIHDTLILKEVFSTDFALQDKMKAILDSWFYNGEINRATVVRILSLLPDNLKMNSKPTMEYLLRARMTIQSVRTTINIPAIKFNNTDHQLYANKLNDLYTKAQAQLPGEKQDILVALYQQLSEPFFQWCGGKIEKEAVVDSWIQHLSAARHDPVIKKHRGLKDVVYKLLCFLSVIPAMVIGKGIFSDPQTDTDTVKFLNKMRTDVDNDNGSAPVA